jgi:hypothetical protein
MYTYPFRRSYFGFVVQYFPLTSNLPYHFLSSIFLSQAIYGLMHLRPAEYFSIFVWVLVD